MVLYGDMTQTLNESTDKVFMIVAKCFAAGGTDKNAKANVKEQLRYVWQLSREMTCREIGDRLRNVGKCIIEDKWK